MIAHLLSLSLLAVPVHAQVESVTPDPLDPPAAEVEDVVTEPHETALLLLSAYHGIPTREQFESAIPDAADVLFAIATDPEVSSIHRDRAIGAMAYWPSERVEALYVDLLASEDVGEMVKHRVIGHLSVAFGDDALPLIEPYLSSSDLQFRLTAVSALEGLGTPAALQALEFAARAEIDDLVLERIETALEVGAGALR